MAFTCHCSNSPGAIGRSLRELYATTKKGLTQETCEDYMSREHCSLLIEAAPTWHGDFEINRFEREVLIEAGINRLLIQGFAGPDGRAHVRDRSRWLASYAVLDAWRFDYDRSDRYDMLSELIQMDSSLAKDALWGVMTDTGDYLSLRLTAAKMLGSDAGSYGVSLAIRTYLSGEETGQALQVLERIGTPEAVRWIRWIYSFAPRNLRRQIVDKIGLYVNKSPHYVDIMIDVLNDENLFLRERAIFYLDDFNTPETRNALTERLRVEPIGRLLLYIANALGRHEAQEAIPDLRRLMRGELTEYDYARASAMLALARIGDLESVPELIAYLESKNSTIFEGAARALGILGDRRAFEPLKRIYERQKGKNVPFTDQIVGAIISVAPVDGSRYLYGEMGSVGRWIESDIAHAFARESARDIDEILAGMPAGEAGFYFAQDVNGPQMSLSEFIEIGKILDDLDQSSLAYAGALRALGYSNQPDAAPVIIDFLLKHTVNYIDESARREAVLALQRLRDERAIPILIYLRGVVWYKSVLPEINEALKTLGYDH